MPIFLGPGIRAWPEGADPSVTWLCTAPVRFSCDYPVAIDIAESALAAELGAHMPQCDLVRSLCQVIAPFWSTFEGVDLAREAARLDWNDARVPESDAEENFLAGAIARTLASSGDRIGIILRNPHRYDHVSTLLVRRLLCEAQLSNFYVALEGPLSLAKQDPLAKHLRRASLVPDDGYSPQAVPRIRDLGTKLLAVCDQGLPLKLLQRVGIDSGAGQFETCCGPKGEPWAYLSLHLHHDALQAIPPGERRELHRIIFDNFDPAGWGYLRRMRHAARAKDRARLLSQHLPYIQGMSGISRDFLYRHLLNLKDTLRAGPSDAALARHCLVGAARLAPRVQTRDGFGKAAHFYKQALPLCDDPVVRVKVVRQLANLYAVQRKPAALVQARRWYGRAFAVLSQIRDPEVRFRTRVELLNGLALVEYHEHNNREALSLELRARDMASTRTETHPYTARWAMRLLGMNTAKLLERRFGDVIHARQFLQDSVSHSEAFEQEAARLELARLHYDSGNHHAVVEALSSLFERGTWLDIDEHQELLGRFMLTLSLIKLENYDQAGRQLERLVYLCRSLDVEGSEPLLAAITRMAGHRGSAQFCTLCEIEPRIDHN